MEGNVAFVLELLFILSFFLLCVWLAVRSDNETNAQQVLVTAPVPASYFEEVKQRNVSLLEKGYYLLKQKGQMPISWVRRQTLIHIKASRERQLERIEQDYRMNRISEAQYLELMDQILDLLNLEKATQAEEVLD
ncbi:hypothetical protein GCM10023189_01950 [Nibrella saemangeumensis]|uniref:Uncharacterized protein n=1 Tax=Nibrella saemangeumensis TaxID=1084526 RepID=A0ABP8M8W2_9BACT